MRPTDAAGLHRRSQPRPRVLPFRSIHFLSCPGLWVRDLLDPSKWNKSSNYENSNVTAGFLLAFASIKRACAASVAARPEPRHRIIHLPVALDGRALSINVGLPPGYKAGDGKKYPALIVTDGDFVFRTSTQASTLEGAITPLFIISIGTSLEEGEPEHTRRRIYEFSPPGWDRQDQFGQAVEGYCKQFKSPEGRCTGGAAKFLAAITSEMIPLLAAKFPVDTSPARSLRTFGRGVLHLMGDLSAEHAVQQVHHLQSRNGVRPRRDLPPGSRLRQEPQGSSSRHLFRGRRTRSLRSAARRHWERSSAACRIWPACLPAGNTGTENDDRVPPRDGTRGRDGNFGGARAAHALREVALLLYDVLCPRPAPFRGAGIILFRERSRTVQQRYRSEHPSRASGVRLAAAARLP